MLTKPVHGWSDFQLDGTSIYGLSYIDDIAFVTKLAGFEYSSVIASNWKRLG